MATQHEIFLQQAIELAVANAQTEVGGPFGALVVKGGHVIATGVNQVTTTNDPTAHAEIVAVRSACKTLGSFQLNDCELYTSCEPCPMCLGALYWARVKAFYYAGDQKDAARGEFDDSLIYSELRKPVDGRIIPGYRLLADQGFRPFDAWLKNQNRKPY